MIFLVDGDNNIGTGLTGVDMLTEHDTVLIFYQKTGLALSRIQKLCAGTRASVQYVESIQGGKNSIDFQIITELGVLAGRGQTDCAYVISQDKGYAPSIEALRVRHASAFQEVALRPSIESCLPLAFILKAKNRSELNGALIKEYGNTRGTALYRRLKSIFQGQNSQSQPESFELEQPPTAQPEPPAAEMPRTEAPAAQPEPEKARTGRSGAKRSRTRKVRAEKAPVETPATEQSAAEPPRTESAAPETPVPEASQPESAAPETPVPEASQPESAAPETLVPDPVKKRRTRTKKAAPEKAGTESAAPKTPQPESVPAEPEKAVPDPVKKRRTRTKKAEPEKAGTENAAPAEPGAAPEKAGAEKPKTSRTHRGGRRKKTAEKETAGA